MKTKLADLKYGDQFTLLKNSDIIYTVISGSRCDGVKVKDQSGAVGKLSNSRYVYKKENNND